MKHYNILFLCTHNSARSILGEAVATTQSGGKFIGYSAGASPSGRVNPFAIEIAKNLGYPIERLRSKNWDEFAQTGAPQMDFIITVCDSAAQEPCPVWIGKPTTAHWGFADPSAVTGTDDEKRAAFQRVADGFRERIQALAAMPIESLDALSLRENLRKVHQQ